MEGGSEGEGQEDAPTRWTCEACGCNTNVSTTDRCGICGTSNSGPSLLRRGGAAAYAARAGWFARSADSRARRAAAIMGADDIMDEDVDLWESVVHDDVAMESLVAAGAVGERGRLVESSRQRFLDAVRAFSQANREVSSGSSAAVADPQELLRAATANASRYEPRWVANPSTTLMGPRSRSGTNGIEVGEAPERQSLAHLPMNAGEGRAIRAEEAFPRDSGNSSNPFASFRMASDLLALGMISGDVNNSDNIEAAAEVEEGSTRCRAYGFRVAFDHPATGGVTGASMGGCYLVGVTTSSFSAYGEQNGLQQSPFFWGIEDGGQKYEGSRHSSGRRRGGAIYAVEIGASEAPMNAHGVLFGAREVITCVCDLESRTLTFWRDETLLGTLVSDLPRNVNLFPVAVPFNCGVTVAITGLNNDPLPLLQTFATDWRRAQIEKNLQTRQLLAEQRAVLIKDGTISPELRSVLGDIFRMYAGDREDEVKCASETTLTSTMAARLWYRCGMKLASLETLMEARQDSKHTGLALRDFLGVIEKVVAEDVANSAHEPTPDVSVALSCEIGDKVELVDGYERYGDAASGPLQIGDRGVVVELQRGPNGEKRSVRVIYGGRRWWYQPQAIQSERSRLIASPGVWFLGCLLRSHGFDCSTLKNIAGNPVTATSWRFGDFVAPRKIPEGSRNASFAGSMIGYIVPDTPGISSSSIGPPNRPAGTVIVEYTSRAFADAVGLKSTGLSSDAKFTIETRRVRTAKLVHAGVDCRSVGLASEDKVKVGDAMETEDSKPSAASAYETENDYLAPSVSENVQSDITALESLDRSAMEALLKECKKSPESLASLFSAGLPDAILSAINTSERLMNSLEPRDDLSEKLAGIGALVNVIADQLYGDPDLSQTNCDSLTMVDADEQPDSSSPNPERNSQSEAVRRNLVREVLARRDARRDQNQDDSLASSLQQRRNILLSLMSRAGRRSNAGAFLNDMAEALGEERELSFDQFPPSIAALRGAPSFVFGSPNDRFGYGEMGWDDPHMLQLAVAAGGSASSPEGLSNLDSPAARNDVESADNSELQMEPSSYLDSLLRCRSVFSPSSRLSGPKPGGAAHSSFVRNLISKGILVDSVEWVGSLVDAHTRKVQLGSLTKTSSLLKDVVDEEGTPLLQLALALGCSVGVIEQLIVLGAAVGNAEIKRAAHADQVETLAVLLKHSSYKDGLINLQHCSKAVAQVLAETKSRQDHLDKKMREVAGKFMIKLVQKLLKIGLSARRGDSARIDMCGKVICEMLVGNVLLSALQKAQQAARRPSHEPSHDLDLAVPDHGGRFPEELAADLKAAPKGLLRTLPRVVLGKCLFAEQGVTSFLLIVEEYLCSKEMNDIASGFSFLLILLRNFPQLRICTEIKRFGISDFVSSHSVLASNRIAEILSKQFTNGLDVSSGGSEDSAGVSEAGIVVCPKKHPAVLHITRHSSFRCDVCGRGVDRGRPMHGCRECDWDLCEDCNPSGLLLKCTEVRELASECHRLLSNDDLVVDTSDEDFDFGSVLESLAVIDSNSSRELNELAQRLLRRDVRAAKDLGDRLNDPGQITFHQFLSVILPAIHTSLVGRTNGEGAGHRSKKAKVAGAYDSSALDSLDIRLEFCRESLRYMVEDVKVSSSDAAQAAVGKEGSEKSNEDKQGAGRVDITYCAGASEILRRFHQILSFNEGVQVFSSSERGGPCGSTSTGKAEDLQNLTKPIELHLLPSKLHDLETVNPKCQAVIYAEPLVPCTDLQLHVLRTFRANDPAYVSFCRRLLLDNSIIIERPMTSKKGPWRVARIVAFDEATGSHRVRYASSWKRGKVQPSLHLSELDAIDFSAFFRFTGSESDLILAARQYFIVFRAQSHVSQKDCGVKDLAGNPSSSYVTMDEGCKDYGISANRLVQAIGTRVESNCGPNGAWSVYTLVGTDVTTCGNPYDDTCFVLVSDEGEVFSGISSGQIRAEGAQQPYDGSRSRRTARGPRDERSGLFPFFATRARDDFARDESESPPTSLMRAKALRRTWSALSLVDAMQPVNLLLSGESSKFSESHVSSILSFSCSLEGSEFVLSAEASRVELPPRLCVKLSCHENVTGIDLMLSPDKTLVWALKEIHQRQGKWEEWPPKPCRLYFSVKAEDPDASSVVCIPKEMTMVSMDIANKKMDASWPRRMENRSRKLCSSSVTADDDDNNKHNTALCDGVNEICIQCMECVNMISECAEDRSSLDEKDGPKLPGFANATLSKKLAEQLEDPVCVVGGALPDWCLAATSFAPRIFSYESRKALLERAAFGPSRSTLKQQEAKINVGRLRQRMASLRARAVELVGEAFSGGASDPTALQLQADELYGMEEALSARVRAAFSAVKWQEHSIQVAKAAVRREKLLADALSVMERYANDDSVSRRRLEVRFEGESGFDAASGDEAGVTRGFYADVAETLLSTDLVAGVSCSSACAPASTVASKDDAFQPMEVDDVEQEEDLKLPLWIPDMDSSAQVIIQTPRADPHSGLGVFPRPIPHYHPQHDNVLERFRLIGRLFAAAMRDGFMFPLPLSASFLKLVQKAPETKSAKSSGRSFCVVGDTILTTGDLPRPGFIGGEVYAAEMFVCRALDRLDSASPPLSRYELKRRYEEIATDKSFAREALGKSYDCSFEEYFQDRVFVDPLDPAQGEDSVPLCPKGFTKAITIYNVREWVALAKNFILHDGVIAQALAFRRGVEDFFPPEYLSVFTAEELHRDVCGGGDQVDHWDESAIRKIFKLDGGKGAAEALVAVAAIGGEGGAALSRRFGPSSPTIGFLVKALLEASPKQRRQFLSFVTSVPIVTPGRIEVVPILSPSGTFLPMRDPGCLPRANTCARRLYLPKFETFETFAEVLWAVVREESRFKGFYEWRGS